MIRGAAAGDAASRAEFAERYGGVARAYLGVRWQRSALAQEIDDCVQEVFLEAFRDGGALARAEPDRPGGFRAFFYGVARNVALRFESRRARQQRRDGAPLPGGSPPQPEDRLSRVFDRAWARSVMREAAALQRARAQERRGDDLRRVELLRLRFYEGMPIREIARLWDQDSARVHHEYAAARREFREVLREVVATYHPGPPEAVERECRELVRFLG